MKCTGGNKENMVSFDPPVLGFNSRAFNKRQQVALHALARDIGSVYLTPASNLVDFVDKHNPVVFNVIDGLANAFGLIHQFSGFLFRVDF